MKHAEGNFKGWQDYNIYYQSWAPDADPRSVLLVAHGFAEHSGRYGNLVNYFVPKGYAVWALDHRGHGRSDGERVQVEHFSDYLKDLKTFYDIVRKENPGKKIYLIGHSMGSMIALAYTAEYQHELAGLVTSGGGLARPGEPPPPPRPPSLSRPRPRSPAVPSNPLPQVPPLPCGPPFPPNPPLFPTMLRKHGDGKRIQHGPFTHRSNGQRPYGTSAKRSRKERVTIRDPFPLAFPISPREMRVAAGERGCGSDLYHRFLTGTVRLRRQAERPWIGNRGCRPPAVPPIPLTSIPRRKWKSMVRGKGFEPLNLWGADLESAAFDQAWLPPRELGRHTVRYGTINVMPPTFGEVRLPSA